MKLRSETWPAQYGYGGEILRIVVFVLLAALLGTCSEPPSLVQQIQTLGELRVVTRNSPTTYYLGPEGPVGPEHDLAQRFADDLGVELVIGVEEELQKMFPDLNDGRVHLAAAGLTITSDRLQEISFGPAYGDISEYLVYKLNSGRPRSPDDLIGKSIEVVKGSAHSETLNQLRQSHPDLTWIETPNVSSEELIYRVVQGDIDYTIADSTEFQVSQKFHPEARVAFELKRRLPMAWAMRKNAPALHARVQDFFARLRENGELEKIQQKYYSTTGDFDYVGTRAFLRHIESRLPRYRSDFQQAGNDTDIDWRLLASIGYQESHWNPNAVSPTGVRGIMMLTSNTARHVGISNRVDPGQSIEGGAIYFGQMLDRIPDRIPHPERLWFALAAYNVGWGHLEDARIIAETRGLNPDKWDDVRDSLPLLTQKKWYSTVKRGYARGWEPVRYVDNIRSYYDVLNWLYSDSSPFKQRLDLDGDVEPVPEAVET